MQASYSSSLHERAESRERCTSGKDAVNCGIPESGESGKAEYRGSAHSCALSLGIFAFRTLRLCKRECSMFYDSNVSQYEYNAKCFAPRLQRIKIQQLHP